MTVKELKSILKDLPENMDIYVSERITEFTYGLVNTASAKEINFMEEPNGKVLSKDKILVLDED